MHWIISLQAAKVDVLTKINRYWITQLTSLIMIVLIWSGIIDLHLICKSKHSDEQNITCEQALLIFVAIKLVDVALNNY